MTTSVQRNRKERKGNDDEGRREEIGERNYLIKANWWTISIPVMVSRFLYIATAIFNRLIGVDLALMSEEMRAERETT